MTQPGQPDITSREGWSAYPGFPAAAVPPGYVSVGTLRCDYPNVYPADHSYVIGT